MMTKEEVAGIVAYCEEKKISYKQRLDELGIPTWKFYNSKRKFAPKQDGDNAGEFLQLLPCESFLSNPIKPSRSRSSRQKNAVSYRERGQGSRHYRRRSERETPEGIIPCHPAVREVDV